MRMEVMRKGVRSNTPFPIRWKNKWGKYNRIYGSSVIWPNGPKLWYRNGRLHREGGPAIEYENGKKEWWLNGKRFTEVEWKERMGR